MKMLINTPSQFDLSLDRAWQNRTWGEINTVSEEYIEETA